MTRHFLCAFLASFVLLGTSSVGSVSLAAEPWEFACTYKSTMAGVNETYERGSEDSLNRAKNDALGACMAQAEWLMLVHPFHPKYLLNGGSPADHCELLSCREPSSCPPTDTSNLELSSRGHRCELNKITGEKDLVILQITQSVRSKANAKMALDKKIAAEQKIFVDAFLNIQSSYEPKFGALIQKFATLAAAFTRDYAASYATTLAGLNAWATFAETAPWRAQVALIGDLSESIRTEMASAVAYESRAHILRNQILATCQNYARDQQPYSGPLAEKNINTGPPEGLCGKAAHRLAEMVSYAKNRSARIKDIGLRLTQRIETNIQFLQSREVDEVTRKALQDASEMASAAAFLQAVNKKTEPLFLPGSTANTYGLAAQSERVARVLEFKLFALQCSTRPASWMFTGCVQIQRYKEPVANFFEHTFPREIRFGLQVVRSKNPGLPGEPFKFILDAVQNHEWTTAAFLFDTLLLKSGGTP